MSSGTGGSGTGGSGTGGSGSLAQRPTVCSPATLGRISNRSNFEAWKALTSTTLNGISSTAAGGGIPPSSAEANALATSSADIFNTVSCIQEKITELGGTTNQIQTTQSAIINVTKQIEEEEANVAIAHDRVAYIRHPEREVSYYESWFPIDRPMHRESTPWFVAVTSFLVLFTLLVILSFAGIDLSFTISPNIIAFYQWVISQFTYTTMILILLLIFTLYYFMNIKQNQSK